MFNPNEAELNAAGLTAYVANLQNLNHTVQTSTAALNTDGSRNCHAGSKKCHGSSRKWVAGYWQLASAKGKGSRIWRDLRFAATKSKGQAVPAETVGRSESGGINKGE